jgi:hypothetical protein
MPETLEQITSQLDAFETTMQDFDNFVSELNIENESLGIEQKGYKEFEVR